MPKKTISLIFILTSILILSSITFISFKNSQESLNTETKKDDIKKDINDTSIKKEIDPIEDQLNNMSLKEKIGEMLIISGKDQGTTLTQELKDTITNIKPGGIIVFQENIKSYEEFTKFKNDIDSLSSKPLFWSIDQEGGTVQRITNLPDVNVTKIPDMYTIGSTNNTNLSENIGKLVGEELRAFGFNMDFAPVIDIWSNESNTVIGKRAFGKTSDQVIKMAIPFAKGLESSNIIPVYKHFPGHGNTTSGKEGDSHYTLPKITSTKEELLNNELLPFKKAIENDAKVIMVAHLIVPALTNSDTLPTSLSKNAITKVLREELNYKGIIITDGLDMKALDTFSEEEVYLKAIDAGVDILLMPKTPKKAVDTIYNAVQNGTISESRIDESVRRILTLKYSMPQEKLDKSYIGNDEHHNIVSNIK